jgi:3-dehydroquinate dehydratase II
MKISIINGPNLNLLGKREPSIYGASTLNEIVDWLRSEYPEHQFLHFQSNVEGTLVDAIQQASEESEGIILNAAGYTHTSVSIADAVAASGKPVIEVHLSNIFSREDYRHVSYAGRHCAGIVAGFGKESYRLAVLALLSMKKS